jgi:hypothetical protein
MVLLARGLMVLFIRASVALCGMIPLYAHYYV